MQCKLSLFYRHAAQQKAPDESAVFAKLIDKLGRDNDRRVKQFRAKEDRAVIEYREQVEREQKDRAEEQLKQKEEERRKKNFAQQQYAYEERKKKEFTEQQEGKKANEEKQEEESEYPDREKIDGLLRVRIRLAQWMSPEEILLPVEEQSNIIWGRIQAVLDMEEGDDEATLEIKEGLQDEYGKYWRKIQDEQREEWKAKEKERHRIKVAMEERRQKIIRFYEQQIHNRHNNTVASDLEELNKQLDLAEERRKAAYDAKLRRIEDEKRLKQLQIQVEIAQSQQKYSKQLEEMYREARRKFEERKEDERCNEDQWSKIYNSILRRIEEELETAAQGLYDEERPGKFSQFFFLILVYNL